MPKTSGVPFSYPQWWNPAGQQAAADSMYDQELEAAKITGAEALANPGGVPQQGAASSAPTVGSPGSLALGAIQTGIGLYGLSQLAKEPLDKYSASPELIATQNAAAQNAKFGYSPQQKAAFDANMGINFNTTLANAKSLGGGSVSKSLAAILHGNTLGAYNNFAAQDFSNKRSNQQYSDQVGYKKQEIQDRNTTMAINRRNLLEQQYGAAASSGLTNMASSFNLGAALKYMA
jgi:hypothetical protein